MKKKKRDPKLWWIVGLLNVLVIEYPASLCLDSADGDAHIRAVFILAGVMFVLALADMFAFIRVLAE